LSTA